ncbi:MAG: hypothetical protein RSE12_08905 [Fuscovulum sp.]|nr:MAG: hypothetical protein RSE12_08905 [Fuscovulum sp.]
MTDAAQMQNPAPLEREPGYSRHGDFITSRPTFAQRITKRADLPKMRDPAIYLVEDAAGTARHVVQKRARQVLEALMREPIFCASPVRLGPAVQQLREIFGEGAIETVWHEVGEGDEYTRFGSYHLRAGIRRASE